MANLPNTPQPSTPDNTKIRYVVMAVFLVLIVGPAATFIWTTSRQFSVEDGPVPWILVAAFVVFGLLFLTVFSLIFSRIRKMTRGVASAQIQKSTEAPTLFEEGDPQAPWLLKSDWRSGKIECGNQGAMIGVWVLAIVFLIITTAANFDTLQQILETREIPPAFGLLFLAAALLGVVFAIYCTMRWKKYGASIFEIKNRTGRVGGALTGTLRCTRDVHPKGEYAVELVCKEAIVTGSGKNRRTTTHRRWEKKITLPGNSYSVRSGVPISIPIESGCLATDDPRAQGTVTWELTVTAATLGVDYWAAFVVPVFHVK